MEFGPFSAEFGVVDGVAWVAIWHGCPLGETVLLAFLARGGLSRCSFLRGLRRG